MYCSTLGLQLIKKKHLGPRHAEAAARLSLPLPLHLAVSLGVDTRASVEVRILLLSSLESSDTQGLCASNTSPCKEEASRPRTCRSGGTSLPLSSSPPPSLPLPPSPSLSLPDPPYSSLSLPLPLPLAVSLPLSRSRYSRGLCQQRLPLTTLWRGNYRISY